MKSATLQADRFLLLCPQLTHKYKFQMLPYKPEQKKPLKIPSSCGKVVKSYKINSLTGKWKDFVGASSNESEKE